MSEIFDQGGRTRQHQLVVVDDEHPARLRRPSGGFRRSTMRVAATGTLVARGSHNCTAVPTFGALSIRRSPPDWAANPCTIDNPSPVPLPGPLVVKKGSVALASVCSSMPMPVSAMLIRKYSPGGSRESAPAPDSGLLSPPR